MTLRQITRAKVGSTQCVNVKRASSHSMVRVWRSALVVNTYQPVCVHKLFVQIMQARSIRRVQNFGIIADVITRMENSIIGMLINAVFAQQIRQQKLRPKVRMVQRSLVVGASARQVRKLVSHLCQVKMV